VLPKAALQQLFEHVAGCSFAPAMHGLVQQLDVHAGAASHNIASIAVSLLSL
jgi:hypothetical protein